MCDLFMLLYNDVYTSVSNKMNCVGILSGIYNKNNFHLMYHTLWNFFYFLRENINKKCYLSNLCCQALDYAVVLLIQTLFCVWEHAGLI